VQQLHLLHVYVIQSILLKLRIDSLTMKYYRCR